MFGVAKHITLKMAIRNDYVLQKTFISFYKPQIQTGPTKNPKYDMRKIATFWAQKPFNLELRTSQ